MAEDNFTAFIAKLREKCNIVDVVRRYADLEQKGYTYWAKCPLHGEKTPSFTVNEAKGTFHCFGCGKGGDAISFIQEIEHCGFMDAVKILADRAGMEVPSFKNDGASDAIKRKKDRLYQLMREAALRYHENLKSPQAKDAMEYIAKRKLNNITIKNFALGYSIGYNDMPDYLASLGYTREEMIESGVCEEKNGKLYDAEFSRLIVPILNNTNNVIAFGGRSLTPTDFAKYKNTKETVIFEKRKELFGVHTLKRFKKDRPCDELIVVEGYMDVISLYQAGIGNVCASMGTALTPEQVRLIKYFAKTVYLCYDGDSAGRKATYRGIDVLRDGGVNVKVVSLPNDLDPDDYIKQYGAESFKDRLKEALAPTDYKLRVIMGGFDMSQPADRGRFAVEGLKIICELPTIVEREAYIPTLAKMSRISEESLKNQLFKNGKNAPVKAAAKPEAKREKLSAEKSAYYSAMRYILYAIFSDFPFTRNCRDLSVYLYDEGHKQLWDRVRELRDSGKAPSLEMLKEMASDIEEVNNIKFNEYAGMKEDVAERMFKDCMRNLESEGIKLQKNDLTKLAEDENISEAEQRVLYAKLQELTELQNKLKQRQ